MKTSRLLLFLPVLVLASTASSFAGGDAGAYHHESTAVRIKEKHSHNPFVYIGRGVETFLHWPQLLSEGIEGDRVLVNRYGVLAPREMPVEERIISSED